MTTKVAVLYHGDADGFGAAYALWREYRDNAYYFPVNHGQIFPAIPDGVDTLYIVDFSYKRDVIERLNGLFDLYIFDHHKSAAEELAGLPYALIDTTVSGCVLTWKQIHPDKDVPLLLQYVQDRDLWRWSMPYSKAVSAYLEIQPKTFEAWDTLVKKNNLISEALTAEPYLAAYQRTLIEWITSNVRTARLTCSAGTFNVPMVNTSVLASEVCNYLCAQYPDAPFAMSYMDTKEGMHWSMRSTGDIDLSEIARACDPQGGGHKSAAGFTTTGGWPSFIEVL